jgi:hypothetical protein
MAQMMKQLWVFTFLLTVSAVASAQTVQSTGTRQVFVSKMAGATLGDKLAAAKKLLNGPGELVIEDGGEINFQFVVETGQTVRLTGGNYTVSSKFGPGGHPYILMKSGSRWTCDNHSMVIKTTSAPGTFVTLKPYNYALNGKDRDANIDIIGCRWSGVGKTGDAAQAILSMGNLQGGLIENNVFEDCEAICVNVGGGTMTIASAPATHLDTWKNAVIRRVENRGVNGAYSSVLITLDRPHEYRTGDRVAIFDMANSTDLSPSGPLRTHTYGIWRVSAVPAPNQISISNVHATKPCDSATAQTCGANSINLLNESRNVTVTTSRFVRAMKNGVALACVNCDNADFNRNVFTLPQSASGAAIDFEANTEWDSLTSISVTHNKFDFIGSAGNVAVSAININSAGTDFNGGGLIAFNIIKGDEYYAVNRPQGSGSLDANANRVVNKVGNSIPQVGIGIVNMRDLLISQNIIRGGYLAAIEATGERLVVDGNIVSGTNGGNLLKDSADPAYTLNYSIIRDNVCETKDKFGRDTSYNTSCAIIEINPRSGNNQYLGNIGVTEYRLHPSSRLWSMVDRNRGLQFPPGGRP